MAWWNALYLGDRAEADAIQERPGGWRHGADPDRTALVAQRDRCRHSRRGSRPRRLVPGASGRWLEDS